MRPRYLWLIVLAAVVGAALLTATAAASAAAVLGATEEQADFQGQGAPPPPPPPPPPPGRGIDRMLRSLDLSEAQVEQVKALRDAARTASDPYEEQVGKVEKEIRAAIESGSFNEEAVRALALAQSKATAELRVIQAKTDAAILALLTAEQREALKTMTPPPPPPRPRRGPLEEF